MLGVQKCRNRLGYWSRAAHRFKLRSAAARSAHVMECELRQSARRPTDESFPDRFAFRRVAAAGRLDTQKADSLEFETMKANRNFAIAATCRLPW